MMKCLASILAVSFLISSITAWDYMRYYLLRKMVQGPQDTQVQTPRPRPTVTQDFFGYANNVPQLQGQPQLLPPPQTSPPQPQQLAQNQVPQHQQQQQQHQQQQLPNVQTAQASLNIYSNNNNMPQPAPNDPMGGMMSNPWLWMYAMN